jgi:hypothetical protein
MVAMIPDNDLTCTIESAESFLKRTAHARAIARTALSASSAHQSAPQNLAAKAASSFA